jgi:hypothetical protein
MARQVFVLEEVLAILKGSGATPGVIETFQRHATFIAAKRNAKTMDAVTVSSSFGSDTRRGSVELTMNDQLSQMPPAKAREIGIMLLEAAEAAMSDEIFVTLLTERLGLERDAAARVLIDLREIRQGTRGTSWPS